MESGGRWSSVLLVLALSSPAVSAQERGGLIGWVDDGSGGPVPGVVISLFGKGIGGSLVTFSDSAGRFFLPSLPPGNYTLRALGNGRPPAAARRVTVLPNRDSIFNVSLGAQEEEGAKTAVGSQTLASDAETRVEELRWVLRHKRRSVLESRDDGAEAAPGKVESDANRLLASLSPDLNGSVELVADPGVGKGGEASGDGPVTSLSVLRLEGRISEKGHWSLAGLVSESDTTAWRMAGEFVMAAPDGHEVQIGTGYGTRLLRAVPTQDPRIEGRGVGAVALQDRWEPAEGLVATVGGRFSYVGFLREATHLDPMASLELRRDANTRLRGSMTMRTLVPGGDLLTVSSLASAPSTARMDESLRAQQSVRFELAMDHSVGPITLRAQAFYEGVRDQLLGSFEGPTRSLGIINAGDLAARGMGLTVSRRFGHVLSGQVTYTYGHSWRESPIVSTEGLASCRESDFHDIVARVETFIPESDTRLTALYRFNSLSPVGAGEEGAATRSSRFDVQVNQALPFLGGWTRADWDLLLAVRNLFYEASEGAALDEVAVVHPPTRVLGGVAVRF